MIVEQKQKQQQILVSLGDGNYMDYATSFKMIKNQSLRISPLTISSNILFGISLLLCTGLKNM